ncbi:hypothetical protein LTR17_003026 [Elasticomyces elasticus]|nr:hypothetical protein LTR17_003026 [Elasticomyces elasticus]
MEQQSNKRPHPDPVIPQHFLQQCQNYANKAIKIEHGIEISPTHTVSDDNDLRASSASLGEHGLTTPMYHAVDASTLPAAETSAVRHVQSNVHGRPEQEPEAVQDTTLSLYMSTLKHFDSSNPMYTIAVSQVLDYARDSPERVNAILAAVQESGLGPVKTTPIVDAIAGVEACHSAAALASTVSSPQDLNNVLRAFHAGLPGTLQSSFSAVAAVNAGGTSDCSQAFAVSQPLSPASSQSRSDTSDLLSVAHHGQVPATAQSRQTTPSAKMESTPAPAPTSAVELYSHDLPVLPAPTLITWVDIKPLKGTFQAIYTVNTPNAPSKLYSFFLPLHATIGGRIEIEQAWFRPWHGTLRCESCSKKHSSDHVCKQAEKVRGLTCKTRTGMNPVEAIIVVRSPALISFTSLLSISPCSAQTGLDPISHHVNVPAAAQAALVTQDQVLSKFTFVSSLQRSAIKAGTTTALPPHMLSTATQLLSAPNATVKLILIMTPR